MIAGRAEARPRAPRVAGLVLSEALVALALLSLALVIALGAFGDARRLLDRAERRVDRQHAARAACGRMLAELRMAGFNHDPDGDAARRDEPIEAALATALTLRGDFDAGTPEARTPERQLEAAGVFEVVSVGNDEIVTWALANPRSRDTLEFAADVAGRTRDGIADRVQVPRVSLAQDAPPYTLYRITLAEDGSAVKVPVADGVHALRFHYFDDAGQELTPPGGAEDESARALRASIRRVAFELEWVSHATRHAGNDRAAGADRLLLSGRVTLRNRIPASAPARDDAGTPSGGPSTGPEQ